MDENCQKLLEQIKQGELTMHSKFYFRLKFALACLIIFFTLLLAIFILTFIFFSWRASEGIFPLSLLIADLVLIWLCELLVRRFRFGYKRSVLYLVLAISAVTIATSVVIDQITDLQEGLAEQNEQHDLPFIGIFYEEFGPPRQLK